MHLSSSSFSMASTLLVIISGLFIAIGLYCLFLFIKLATRAIKALDIYLDEKRDKNDIHSTVE